MLVLKKATGKRLSAPCRAEPLLTCLACREHKVRHEDDWTHIESPRRRVCGRLGKLRPLPHPGRGCHPASFEVWGGAHVYVWRMHERMHLCVRLMHVWAGAFGHGSLPVGLPAACATLNLSPH